jgi:NAD(P)-dependent dehydrogenase (short-subunit alcohol dehydrogenase family)
MGSFTGKNILVTGATGGIGQEIASAFAAQGGRVCVTGRSDGSDFAKTINGRYYRLDVAEESNVIAVYEQIIADIGKLDVIVLNAGVALEDCTLEEFSSDKARTMLDINVMGTFYGLKHGTPAMNDGGAIITIGSAAGGGMTVAMQGMYSATKAGVHYLTRTVAIEQGHRGIRANTILPASIAGTGMMVDDDGSSEAKFFGGITALGHMGKLTDVANMALFLASDQAGFITGGEFPVDGGLTTGLSNSLVEGLLS